MVIDVPHQRALCTDDCHSNDLLFFFATLLAKVQYSNPFLVYVRCRLDAKPKDLWDLDF